MVFFRRSIIIRAVFSGFTEKTALKGFWLFFYFRICVCECPVGVNCPWKNLATTDFFIYLQEYTECGWVCAHSFTCMYIHICIRAPRYIFRVVLFIYLFIYYFCSLALWVICKLVCVCLYVCVCECVQGLVLFMHVYLCVCVCVCG